MTDLKKSIARISIIATAFACAQQVWGAAGQATTTIDSFASTNFSPVSTGDVAFRFTELFPASDTNASTHILIDGLVEVEPGSGILSSTYAGIDISTGTEYDTGHVLLTLPSGAQTTGATSPIVGIVPRTTPSTGGSGWSQFTNTATISTVGGASGTVDFDSDAGTLSFNLTRDATTFTGTATYSASQDGTTVSIDAFSLTDGSTTYAFEASSLLVVDGVAAGVIVSADASPGYDSILFNISFDSDLQSSGSGWGGYSVDANGWIDGSADWIGFVNVGIAPFTYSFSMDRYMYMPEPAAGFAGAWGYVFTQGTSSATGGVSTWAGYPVDANSWVEADNWIGFFNIGISPYGYIFSTDSYIYIAAEPSVGFAGEWVYFYKK